MALQKEFETNTGVTGNYIRIGSIVNLINGQNECQVNVQFWKDESVRSLGNKQPLDTMVIPVYLGSGDTILEKCYNGLKDISDFSGATDV